MLKESDGIEVIKEGNRNHLIPGRENECANPGLKKNNGVEQQSTGTETGSPRRRK